VISRALRSLGRVLAEEGELAESRRLLDESLVVRRRLEDRRSISNTLSALGRAALLAGDLDAARGALEESISLARELDDKLRLAEPLYFLALVALEEENETEARALIEERLALCREVGDRLGIAESLDLVARLNREPELLGAAAAIRAQLGAQIWPFEAGRREELEASLRAEVGDAAYDAALAEGAMHPVEQAHEVVA
jgi:tetratricopeptide (TPR) repeat protein